MTLRGVKLTVNARSAMLPGFRQRDCRTIGDGASDESRHIPRRGDETRWSIDWSHRIFSVTGMRSDIQPRSGQFGDPRLSIITIRNLLSHSGGWDATKSGEPIVAPFSQQIAAAMGVPFPPTPKAIISYMLDRPLDFDPGTRFAYSNFGFLVLGRVIEKISGMPFSDFVRQQILVPLRIQRMHLGRTPLSLRIPGEVVYYDYPGAPLVDSLMPGVGGKVSEPYSGVVALESIDSAGGWIASPIDLVRIFTMLDGRGRLPC